MSKVLVAYYSWSGNTERAAKAIAEALGADLEAIKDRKPRRGLFAYVRSGMEAAGERAAPIAPAIKSAANYDLVLLGFPVWAGKMASPMRSYILRERAIFKQIALFCTLGGAGGEAALAGAAALCQRTPVATFAFDERTLRAGPWREQAAAFARSVSARRTR
ncbi:MAG: hypothetical protein K2P58_03445 [Hyphomonadaceae bacterium]|nr:hypothetical protein [Hyphomonadaceae bacterium]